MFNEYVERFIVVGLGVQFFMCLMLVYKQVPPRAPINPFRGNNTVDDRLVLHDDLLPDDRVIVMDDDNEGMLKLGPTESPKIQKMRMQLYDLNYGQARSDDPELIKIIRNYWIRWPSKRPYNLDSPDKEDFSMGQSLVVDNLLNKKEFGFFVECGALDGEIRSNSLFFERKRHWTGLLIEAGPINYRQMTRKNRKAYMSPACLGVHPYPAGVSFNRGRNRGRLINRDEAFDWIKRNGLPLKQMLSQCFPLHSFLLALNRTNIDYLSLDVEGVELDILKTIPFDKIDIKVMTVEFTHGSLGKEALKAFVESKGYTTVTEITHPGNLANDFVFIKNTKA